MSTTGSTSGVSGPSGESDSGEREFAGGPEAPELSRLNTVEAQIMGYLHESIERRGGTARRLSKIRWHVQADDDVAFSRAIESLRERGDIVIEEIADLGFVYARPLR